LGSIGLACQRRERSLLSIDLAVAKLSSEEIIAKMEDTSSNRNGPGSNRLFLNFAGNSDRFQQNDRAYPTTPSTFPQPVFPQGQGQAQQNSNHPYPTAPHAPAGYFMNNPYPPQYPQQAQTSQFTSSQQTSNPTAYTPRNNDPTTGLAQQFSHQNLRDAGRASPQPTRGPLAQRPRTAGATGQQPSYNSYMSAPMPSLSSSQQYLPEFQAVPERNPDKYGPLAQNNQKRCAQLAADFFKDSVKRARDRNVR
jgi:protein-serine/threonine kinase